jgi:hypothetical protein
MWLVRNELFNVSLTSVNQIGLPFIAGRSVGQGA